MASSSSSWLAEVALNRDGQTGAVWPAGQYPEYGICDSESEPDWVSEEDSLMGDEEAALRDKVRRKKEYLKEKQLSAMRRDKRRCRERDIQPMYEKEWRRRDKEHTKEIRHYHQGCNRKRKDEERRMRREEMEEKELRQVEKTRELWRRQQEEEEEEEKKKKKNKEEKEPRDRRTRMERGC
jgi:hypothetical protein